MLPTLELPLAPVDTEATFVLAAMLCESCPGTKVELKDIAPVYVPNDYVSIGEEHGCDIRGKSFPNGSSIVVHCLCF